MGKVVQGEASPSSGYVDLNDLVNIVKQAFKTPSLNSWAIDGGEMIWFYNSQQQNIQTNKSLINYFTMISKF